MVCLENIFVHEICTPDNVLNRVLCLESMDSFSRSSKIADHISIRVGNEEEQHAYGLARKKLDVGWYKCNARVAGHGQEFGDLVRNLLF